MPRMVVPGAAFCVAACLALLTQQGAAENVQAARMAMAQTPHDVAETVMYFDIPSRPLPDALDDFDAATGFSGLYSAADVARHQSVALQGQFTAEAALRKLLEQSGLSSYFTARDAYVLERDGENSSASGLQQSQQLRAQSELAYDALLQSGVRTAFCNNALIVPGEYRIALSFRVAANGRVEQARLLDTTGNRARDAEILKSLRAIRFSHGPVNSTAPFVMLILPRSQSSVADCGGAS